MARLSVKAAVVQVYRADNGRNFYTLADLSGCGGVFQIALDGAMDGVTPGSIVQMDIDVAINRGQKGIYIEYKGGTVEKAKG